MAITGPIHLGDIWPAGEDFSFNVPVNTTRDSTGTPVNISTYALSFSLIKLSTVARNRAAWEANSLLPAKTTGGAITFANGVHPIGSPLAGQSTGGTLDMAKVAIADTDHPELNDGKYQWALWRSDAGQERKLSWGTVGTVQG